jgi:hypothetical protein
VHLASTRTGIALHASVGESAKIARGMTEGSFSHGRILRNAELSFTLPRWPKKAGPIG